MMSWDLVVKTLVTISIVGATFLHIVGTCILTSSWWRTSRLKIGEMYIVSLSLSEIGMNLLYLIQAILYNDLVSMEKETVRQIISKGITLFNMSGISLIFYMNMLYIALDKLMEVMLNIRHLALWNKRKARRLLVASWVISLLLGTITCIIYMLCHLQEKFLEEILNVYVFPVYDLIFLCIAISTYTFLFKKFKESRAAPTAPRKDPRASTWKVFRQSNFYTSVLLISSFIIFTIVPDAVYTFYFANDHNDGSNIPDVLHLFCTISYRFSSLAHALIYFFTLKSVKVRWSRFLKNAICCCFARL